MRGETVRTEQAEEGNNVFRERVTVVAREHATTSSCLAFLLRYELTGDHVL